MTEETSVIQAELAKMAAKRAAKQAEKATKLDSEHTTTETPAKPADITQADWDKLPADVRTLIAQGPGAQAVPVNPPEATQGLIESATERAAAPAAEAVEEKPKKTRAAKAVAAPSLDLAPVVAAIEAGHVDLAPVVAAIEANTKAVQQLAEAVLGAANIFVDAS